MIIIYYIYYYYYNNFPTTIFLGIIASIMRWAVTEAV